MIKLFVKRTSYFIFSFILICIGCTKVRYSVDGIVVDDATGLPIEKVVVHYYYGDVTIDEVETDPSGHFYADTEKQHKLIFTKGKQLIIDFEKGGYKSKTERYNSSPVESVTVRLEK
jgi:hypothetical protein